VTAADLLTQARAAGLTVSLEPPSRLTLRGDPASVARWAPVLRPHKLALLPLLSAPPSLTPETQEAIAEAIEERAAVRELDGGEPRPVAEREARSAMRVYDLLVAMGEGQTPRWVTMLAPGCSPAEARRIAEGKFGAERLLAIRERLTWR
jgi:hypothetical protein